MSQQDDDGDVDVVYAHIHTLISFGSHVAAFANWASFTNTANSSTKRKNLVMEETLFILDGFKNDSNMLWKIGKMIVLYWVNDPTNIL